MIKMVFSAFALLFANAVYAAEAPDVQVLSESGDEIGYLADAIILENGDTELTSAMMFTGVREIKEGDKCYKVTIDGHLKSKKKGENNLQEPVTTESRAGITCPADHAI
jgi:hypothetical protein